MTEAAKNDTAPPSDEELLAEAAARIAGEPEKEEVETVEADSQKDADDDSGDEKPEEKDTEAKKRSRRPSRRDRAIAELRQENAEIKRALEEFRRQTKPAESKEPREQDFNDYNDYLKARDEFSREQGKREASEEAERKRIDEDKRKQAEDITRRAHTLQERGRAKYSDFVEVALDPASFDPSPEVAQVILDSDMAEDVAYHIGSNPDLADRLEAMTAIQAAREVGRIEASLTKPKPKATSAPSPVKPIGPGKDSPSKNLADIAKSGNLSEYRKAAGL